MKICKLGPRGQKASDTLDVISKQFHGILRWPHLWLKQLEKAQETSQCKTCWQQIWICTQKRISILFTNKCIIVAFRIFSSLEEVSSVASKEAVLSESLARMKGQWSGAIFRFAPYKATVDQSFHLIIHILSYHYCKYRRLYSRMRIEIIFRKMVSIPKSAH